MKYQIKLKLSLKMNTINISIAKVHRITSIIEASTVPSISSFNASSPATESKSTTTDYRSGRPVNASESKDSSVPPFHQKSTKSTPESTTSNASEFKSSSIPPSPLVPSNTCTTKIPDPPLQRKSLLGAPPNFQRRSLLGSPPKPQRRNGNAPPLSSLFLPGSSYGLPPRKSPSNPPPRKVPTNPPPRNNPRDFAPQRQAPLPHTNKRNKTFKTQVFENKNNKNNNKPSQSTAPEEVINLDTS